MDTRVSGGTLRVGAFRFDRLARRLWRRSVSGDWEPVALGSRASELLAILTDKPGEVVARDAIMDTVWPGVAVEPNNLAVQIGAVRRVLGDGAIETVSGRGYRLTLPVVSEDSLPASTALPPASAPTPVPAPPLVALRRRPSLIGRTAALIAAGLLAILVWHGGWFSSTRELPRLSLIVLPFANLGGDTADGYLVAGITDGLTTALSHIPGAFVISAATAFSYQGKAQDVRQIGQELAVRYVVRGSVQRFGSTLRVNAELALTENGAQLWSDSFDQKIADLAGGQDQIVARMRSALNISLADIEAARSLRERPTNPDAFDLVLRARAVQLLPVTKGTTSQTLGLYEQALQRDPNSVLALTGVAQLVLRELFLDLLPYEVATDRAHQYLERARTLQPNAEQVLAVRVALLDWQQDGLDYQRVRLEMEAAATRLIEYYPNNFVGYFELGVRRRNQGRYDDATSFFAKTIQLGPRDPNIKNIYWNMAYCLITAGHDREGLEWADRAIAAEGALPTMRERYLLSQRIVAYFRLGDIDTAEQLAATFNDRYPLGTWRERSPNDPDSEMDRVLFRGIAAVLSAAGIRDHLDPSVDFGVAADDVLHSDPEEKTPTTAPGVTTVSTEQLAAMLETGKPLVIDDMENSWHRSVPGAVGLDFHGKTYGTFKDAVQQRLEQKLRTLTGGDTARPIVAVGFNVGWLDGYNLALRIVHAGYSNVYWYRGGREAWEVAGKPEDVVRPADW
jgi:TolB-like protein/DNA-binding winged helix-turn-helix (wHTH) protein